MTLVEIEQALSQGVTTVAGWKVKVSQRHGRYIAYLSGPTYNTVVECPREILPEGARSFYERVALAISFRSAT